MKKTTLSRKQILTLIKIIEKYPEQNWLTIESKDTTGIGNTDTVILTSDGLNIRIDITDVDSW